MPPQRILVVRLSAIGDVINTLPMVDRIREELPQARISFAVEDKAASVVEGHPSIDRVIVFPRKRWRRFLRGPAAFFRTLREVFAYVRALRREEFDVVLDVQGNLKGALHSFLSGAPRRIGFARGHCYEMNYLFSTERITPPPNCHRVEKFASLLGALGLRTDRLRLSLGRFPEESAVIENYLRSAGLTAGGFVVVHPGTSGHGREKRWPVDRFGALAARIHQELGREVLVTWGPGEKPMAEDVCRWSGDRARMAPETRSLKQLAELIRRASVFLSSDTGPMHLAAACGVPCVALFGPKDPAIYRPYGKIHRVIRPPASSGPPSMHAIAVEEVFAEVRRMLERPAPEPAGR